MQTADGQQFDAKPAKRALFIVITDNAGGAERVSFGLASELAARPEWDVEVMIVSAKIADSFSKQVLPPGIPVRYGLMRNWYVAFALLPLRLLFRRYDLVFTTQIYTSALVAIMRRWHLLRANTHITRESASLLDYFSDASAARKTLISRLYRLYGGEALIIAQTRYMADKVRPQLPGRSAERLRVIPNPVDVTAIREGASVPLDDDLRAQLTTEPTILFCGRLIEVKQPGLALAAFDMLVRTGCPARLAFVGGGHLEGVLRADARRRGLQDRVLFLGRLINPFSAMAACKYGLVTSSKEGFPNVILEMMAGGLSKIVVTPCAGDLDQLPGVTVTRTFDAEEIAAALRDSLETGENCSEVYRRFAATRSVSAYLDAMLQLA